MSPALPLVKQCEACGEDYRRPTGTQRLTDAKWAERRYCSGACGFSAAGKAHAGTSPGAPAAFDAKQHGNAMATQALLDRTMKLYRRVARERGLANEWEAAVLMGMAA